MGHHGSTIPGEFLRLGQKQVATAMIDDSLRLHLDTREASIERLREAEGRHPIALAAMAIPSGQRQIEQPVVVGGGRSRRVPQETGGEGWLGGGRHGVRWLRADRAVRPRGPRFDAGIIARTSDRPSAASIGVAFRGRNPSLMNQFPRPHRSRFTVVALVAVAAIGGLVGCMKGKSSEQLLADGEYAYRYGRYEEAAGDFRQVLDRYPGDVQANIGYARTQIALGNLDAARSALETAAASKPEDFQISLLLAEVLFKQGDTTRLYQLLRDRAIEQRRPEAWIVMARYSLELDDPDTAQAAVVSALEISDDSSPEPYLLAAELAERVGDQKEALRRLRQAYGLAPNDPRIEAMLREYGEVPGPTIALPPGR
jgi:Flp pilus assembly protein TadD